MIKTSHEDSKQNYVENMEGMDSDESEEDKVDRTKGDPLVLLSEDSSTIMEKADGNDSVLGGKFNRSVKSDSARDEVSPIDPTTILANLKEKRENVIEIPEEESSHNDLAFEVQKVTSKTPMGLAVPDVQIEGGSFNKVGGDSDYWNDEFKSPN